MFEEGVGLHATGAGFALLLPRGALAALDCPPTRFCITFGQNMAVVIERGGDTETQLALGGGPALCAGGE